MIDALYVGHVVGQGRVTFTCYARQMADSPRLPLSATSAASTD